MNACSNPTTPLQTMLRVEQVSDISELARYKREWQALAFGAAEAAVFDTYEWLTTWLECFWEDKAVAFLFCRDQESLLGVAPLLDDKMGENWCGGTLTTPFNGCFPRTNVLCNDDAPPILEALLQHLVKDRRCFRLAFPRIPADGAVVRAMAETANRRQVHTRLVAGSSSPLLRIHGDWEGFLKSQSRHTARETRRKVKRFENAGHADRVVVDSSEGLDRAMADILHIEENSWKEEAGSSFTAGEHLTRFYSTFASRAAENGWLRLYLLYLDSQPVAHIYGVVFRNHYYALKTSYHSAYRQLAPGIALFDHAFRDAFERGFEAFHLLGEISRWKQEFTNDVEKHVSMCVFTQGFPRCAWCDFYHCHLKSFVKTRMPFLVAAKKKIALKFSKD